MIRKKNAYLTWLKKHLKEATSEYKRIRSLEDKADNDANLYDRVHEMWGYLAGLEKCLKEFEAQENNKE